MVKINLRDAKRFPTSLLEEELRSRETQAAEDKDLYNGSRNQRYSPSPKGRGKYKDQASSRKR